MLLCTIKETLVKQTAFNNTNHFDHVFFPHILSTKKAALHFCLHTSGTNKLPGRKFMTVWTSTTVYTRGIPIIGSAKILATNMVVFTNIGIGTEQHKDRYHYQ